MKRRDFWRLGAATVASSAMLTACSTGGSAGGAKKGEPGKFVVYAASGGGDLQSALQKGFGDANNVTIQVVAYPTADFLAQFQNAVRSNAEVDGLLVNGQNVGFLQANGLLAPMDDLVDKSAFQPAATDPFLIEDKLWAVGSGTLNTSMMAYNNDLFNKYGLSVPTTFDEIKAGAATLKSKAKGVSLLGFGGATVFQWPMWYMEMLQQTSGDKPTDLTKQTLSGQGPDFTAKPYVEAMGHLQKLGASGAFAPGLMGTANTAAQADFLAGKSAMYWYGSWVISQFVDQAKFDIKITSFPQFVDGVTPRPVGGVTGAVALYSKVSKDKQELAKKFVQWVASDAGDEAMIKVAAQGFTFPTNKGVTTGSQSEIEKQVSKDFIPQTFGFLDWLWPSAVTTAFQQNIQAVVGQQKSPGDAMKAIQQAFTSTQ